MTHRLTPRLTHRDTLGNGRPPWDERQLALLVGLCVAACREVLQPPASQTTATQAQAQVRLGRDRWDRGSEAPTDPYEVNAAPTPQHPEQPDPTPGSEPKLLLTVEEAAARLSIGRPKMWQLVMRGEVVSLKIGASRRVPVAALEQYVQRLSAEAVEAFAASSSAAQAKRGEMYGNSRLA